MELSVVGSNEKWNGTLPDSSPRMRGFEVVAIVVCSVIVAAIVMCYFTWRFRYKIVLRTKTQETTVVQNLVALTLQGTIENGRMARRSETISHPLQDIDRNIVQGRPNFPAARLTSDTMIDDEEARSPDRIFIEIMQSKERNKDVKTVSQNEVVRLGANTRGRRDSDKPLRHGRGPLESRDRRFSLGATDNSKFHGKSKYSKRRRSLVPSAVKLSSGQSLPTTGDPNKLSGGSSHPLADRHRDSSQELEGSLLAEIRDLVSEKEYDL